jgi:hypothetical protein
MAFAHGHAGADRPGADADLIRHRGHRKRAHRSDIEVAQSTEGWSALRKLQVAPQYLGLRGVDATILRCEVR